MNTFTASRFDTSLAYPDEPHIEDVGLFLHHKTLDSILLKDSHFLSAFQDDTVISKILDCYRSESNETKLKALAALNSAIYDYVHESHEEEYNESN